MPITLTGPLLLAGCGNMGGALLAGWLADGLDPALVRIQDPGPNAAMAELLMRHGLRAEAAVSDIVPAVIVVAVKPQVMDAVFPPLARLAGPDTIVMSVAAGRTMAGFAGHLPPRTAIVRTIPNTPSAVGRGITAAVANAYVTDRQRAVCDGLLRSVGAVAWLDDEAQIDAATAVSGSGPAYVFLLAEALAEAGRKAGLPADVARLLARWTVAGAGELLHRSELDADQLRRNVTSPNGTTHAALQILMRDDGLQPLLDEAIAAAAQRARELAA